MSLSISPSAPAEGQLVIVTPSGGTETSYTIRYPNGTEVTCVFGSNVTYTAGTQGTTETVRATDDVTSEFAEVSYTVQ